MTFEQWLQGRLTAHGFACSPVDGIMGPKTVAALKAFEASRGLPVNGTADEAVVDALRKPSSIIPPEVKAVIPDRDREPAIETHQPSSTVWPRESGVPKFFGEVGTQQTAIEVPFAMFLAWDKSTKVRKITLHKEVAESASLALERIASVYSASEIKSLGIDLFGGSLNVRMKRGGSTYSMHSWGIAIDFDPERNQISWKKPKARLSHSDALPFWLAWESQGWLSLGRARDFDWMHVQAARL